MRLSVDPKDPGYDTEKAFGASATLGGVLVEYCITADEDLGLVVCYQLRDGQPFVVLVTSARRSSRSSGESRSC